MSRAFEREALASAEEAMYSEARAVRFQDVDAAAIVFYPRVLEYMSDAYGSFLAARGFHLARSIEAEHYRIPLVHAEADYLAPMRYGDAISVEVVAVKIGRTSFHVGYRVRHADGRVAAVGQTAHVTVGLPVFAPVAIPEALRAALEGTMA
jgi:YbgC/YbaW family acyl-CoA thioester hydrolase